MEQKSRLALVCKLCGYESRVLRDAQYHVVSRHQKTEQESISWLTVADTRRTQGREAPRAARPDR